MSVKTFVFDLDGTITKESKSSRKNIWDDLGYYSSVEPHLEMIERMKKLKENGNRIVIHTARGMGSCGGNIELVKQRLGTVTIDWLRQHEVPYDEIVFGKPFGAYYIDDKNLSIEDFLEGDYEKN